MGRREEASHAAKKNTDALRFNRPAVKPEGICIFFFGVTEADDADDVAIKFNKKQTILFYATYADTTMVCVFITAGPITKLFAGGGGGWWKKKVQKK